MSSALRMSRFVARTRAPAFTATRSFQSARVLAVGKESALSRSHLLSPPRVLTFLYVGGMRRRGSRDGRQKGKLRNRKHRGSAVQEGILC